MLSLTPASCPNVNANAFAAAMHTDCGRVTFTWPKQSEHRGSQVLSLAYQRLSDRGIQIPTV